MASNPLMKSLTELAAQDTSEAPRSLAQCCATLDTQLSEDDELPSLSITDESWSVFWQTNLVIAYQNQVLYLWWIQDDKYYCENYTLQEITTVAMKALQLYRDLIKRKQHLITE
jgi:hypothetical protein